MEEGNFATILQPPAYSCLWSNSLPRWLRIRRERLIHSSVPRLIVYTRILRRSDGLLGQHAFDLDGIHTRDIALESLVSRDPAPRCVAHSDHTLEDLAGALLDGFDVAGELEEGLAVGAAILLELLLGADDGAHHTRAHVAVLAGRNVGSGHGAVKAGCLGSGGVVLLGRRSGVALGDRALLRRRSTGGTLEGGW